MTTQATDTPNPFRLQSDNKPRTLELSEKEMEIILALRRLNFWQFERQALVVLRWNGARCIVLDTKQI